MDMIYVGIIGFVFILLIVFVVMAAKTWHWINIVFVVLTFLATIGAGIGVSQVFELRRKAQLEVKKTEERAEQAEKDAQLAVSGDPLSVTYSRDSLRGAEHELSLATLRRGRVWSGGTVTVNGDKRDYTFAEEHLADGDKQAKLDKSLLYVFSDETLDGTPLPKAYIGTVMVAQDSPTQVTLEPSFISDRKEWDNPSTTWSLYEKMPLDRHDTFKHRVLSIVESNPDAPEAFKKLATSIRENHLDLGLYRQFLMDNYFTPELFGLDPASPEYENLVDRYAFDMISLGTIQNWIDANKGQRTAQVFKPAPEEIFVRYKFNAPSRRSYQVDADGKISEEGLFTPLGYAVDPSLHAGKEIEFKKGDTVWIDLKTAEGYQRGADQIPAFSQVEDVTEIDRRYVRTLRDYPYLLADIDAQIKRVERETERIRANNVIQEATDSDTQSQLADRIKTISGLEQDRKNLENDLQVIEALRAKRANQNQEYRAQIESLNRQIQKTYQEIQKRATLAERQAYTRQ